MNNSIFKSYLTLILFLIHIPNFYSQDFWEKCNGPYGGTISSIWVDSDGTLFVCTPSGIAISSNKGANWRLSELPNIRFVYRASKTGNLIGGTIDRTYYSTDNGNSWITPSWIASGPNGITEDSLGHLYISTEISGIYKSTDDGRQWFPIFHYFGVPALTTIEISPINNFIFAGTRYGKGIYRSTNLGQNWARVDTTLPSYNDCFSIAILQNGEILAVVNGGLYLSIDNGVSWTKKLQDSYEIRRLKILANGNILAASSSSNNNIGNVLISTDSGENWSTVGLGLMGLGISSLNYYENLKDSYIYYAGTNNGLFSFSNGIWSQVGIEIPSIYFMTSEYFQIPIVLSNVTGFLISNDQGNTWRNLCYSTAPGQKIIFLIKNDSTFFSSELYLPDPGYVGLNRSTDKGRNWQNIQFGTLTNISCAALSDNGFLFAGTEELGIYRSSNDGTEWESINNGIQDVSISVIANDKLDNIYIAGFSTLGSRIYFSSNYGNSWEFRCILPFINSIEFNSSNVAFAGTRNGRIYKSSDYGSSWKLIFFGTQIEEITDIEIPNTGTYKDFIFTGKVSSGLFMSSDDGASWVSINSGIPDSAYTQYKIISDSSGRIYVGNSSSLNVRNGLFRNKTNVNDINLGDNLIPPVFKLCQNYPNPFNPSTTINYSLPEKGQVKINVFDILGREITELVNEVKERGNYTVSFDGNNLSSGVYICTMVVNDYKASTKLILAK